MLLLLVAICHALPCRTEPCRRFIHGHPSWTKPDRIIQQDYYLLISPQLLYLVADASNAEHRVFARSSIAGRVASSVVFDVNCCVTGSCSYLPHRIAGVSVVGLRSGSLTLRPPWLIFSGPHSDGWGEPRNAGFCFSPHIFPYFYYSRCQLFANVSVPFPTRSQSWRCWRWIIACPCLFGTRRAVYPFGRLVVYSTALRGHLAVWCVRRWCADLSNVYMCLSLRFAYQWFIGIYRCVYLCSLRRLHILEFVYVHHRIFIYVGTYAHVCVRLSDRCSAITTWRESKMLQIEGDL